MQSRGTPDYEEYVTAWRARLTRAECTRQGHVQRLRQAAHACAQRLVREFGASKVYLFGSLVDESLVHRRSDIDLAVEGLDSGLYFKAWRELAKLLPAGVQLDLVPLEDAWPELADRVREEGVLVDVGA